MMTPAAFGLLLMVVSANDAADPNFDRDILPIFENYCLGCHSTGMRMGSFECDTYEGVMAGATHGAVVVPGKSGESRLYLTLTGKITPAMPMNNRSLNKSELEIIRRWIDSGAKPSPPPPQAPAKKDKQ
jgi:hypothetical protein